MKYLNYEVEDFLKDEDFVQWVVRADQASDQYWGGVIQHSPYLQRKVKVAREIILDAQYRDHYELPVEEYQQMLEHVKRHHHTRSVKPKTGKSWIWKAAAGISLLLGIAYGWYQETHDTAEVTRAGALIVKQTKKGEKRSVQLPDGSMVKLNANSMMVYQATFDQPVRQVKLHGEAFFDVAHDLNRPFVIMSGHVQTTVLGTSLNVRAYEEEPEVQVAVVTGKVQVQAEKAGEVLLEPGEVSHYQKESHALLAHRENIENIVAWRDNTLVFEGDTAAEVWQKLENWYGVNIIVRKQHPIAGHYSGRYHNESLERVLDGISYAAEFEYEIMDGKNVIIK